MLQEQFYYRLLLIVAFGFIYVKTMMKMALYKPAEEAKKNMVMMIIGGIFILLALFEGGMGIYLLTQVQHPTEMIDFIPTPNQIVRPSSTHIIWGHVTDAQWHVVSMITNTMTSLGIGAYFIFFRKSVSKWWEKVLKFLFGALLYAFYVSATDFHYFDMWELWPPVLFCIMVFVVNMKAKQSRKVVTPKEVIGNNTDFATEQAEEAIPSQDDETRFMPKALDEEVNEPLSIFDKEELKESMPQITQEVEKKPVYRFCRYCGKKIDYEGVKYCKHCGKPLD